MRARAGSGMACGVRTALILGSVALSACGGREPRAASPARAVAPIAGETPAVERARAQVAGFRSALQQSLTSALQHGPDAAIEACRVQAPELARVASRDGVVVGRSSTRLRNPANAPPPWLAPLLDELSREPARPGTWRAVALDDGSTGYAETIVVQPLCITCHGANLAPEISMRLRERYPDDRATGYAAGDFRGVFWALVAPGPGPAAR